MSINQLISEDNNRVTINIENNFDFSLHQQFRDSYSTYNKNSATFVLDLSKTEYMDSSALGMILLLKDHADSLNGKVVIKKPNDTVYKILEIAQFHRLVTIEQ